MGANHIATLRKILGRVRQLGIDAARSILLATTGVSGDSDQADNIEELRVRLDEMDADGPERSVLVHALGRAYGNRGVARWVSRRDRGEAAIADYDAAIVLMEALRRDLGAAWEAQTDLSKDLATAYMNRGVARWASRSDRVEAAIADYDAAIVLMEALRHDLGAAWEAQTGLRNGLASAYMNRGIARQTSRAYGGDGAIADYDVAIVLREALRRDLGSAWEAQTGLRNGLAIAYMNRGIAREASRAHGVDAAIADYDVAIALMEALRRDLGAAWEAQTGLRSGLATAYTNRGNARRTSRAHGVDAAIADYDAAVAFREALRHDLGPAWEAQTGLRNDLASAYMNRGVTRRTSRAHGLDAAIADYDAAVALMEALRRDLGAAWEAHTELRNGLATAYTNRGNARRTSRAHGAAAATADFDAAIALVEALRRDLSAVWEPHTELRNGLATAYMNRGNARRTSRNGFDAAIADYDVAIVLREALRHDLGAAWEAHTELRNDLAGAYMNRGTTLQASRAYGVDAAIADFDAAITLREALRRDLGATWEAYTELRNDLAGAYVNRGNARQASRTHGIDAAIVDYDTAIALMEALRRDLGAAWEAHTELRNDLAGANMNRGNARRASRAHGVEAAIADYDAAIALKGELRRDLGATWEAHTELRNDLAGAYVNRGNARQASRTHGIDAAIVDYDAAIALMEALRRDLGAAWEADTGLRNDLAGAYMNRGNARRASRAHGIDAAVADYDAAIAIWRALQSDVGAWLGQSHIVRTFACEADCYAQFGRWAEVRDACANAFAAFEDEFAAAIAPSDRREALEKLRGLSSLAALAAVRSGAGPASVVQAFELLDRGRAIQLREAFDLDETTIARRRPELLDEFRSHKLRLQQLRELLEQPSIEGRAAIYRETQKVYEQQKTILKAAGIGGGRHGLDSIESCVPTHGALLAPAITVYGSLVLVAGRSRLPINMIAAINPDGTLPGAEIERLILEKLFAPSRRAILSGSKATRQAILSQAAQFTHHHYSCHGTFVAHDTSQSALKLADDPLTVRDILSTPGLCDRCRIVVMSACETSMTDIVHLPDEGMGLVMACLSAGAAAVLATQWAVFDDDAADVVGRFYELLLGEHGALDKLSPAQALRLAMLDLRRSRLASLRAEENIGAASYLTRKGNLLELRSPLAWAPFTIWGA
jgi:hypothetical protein